MRWTAWARGAMLALAVATTAFAADVSGKWKAQYQTPDGTQRESLFTFAVSGETLTGTVGSAALGDAKIEDGKVSGDTITFTVKRNFQGNDVIVKYNGKVAGDEIKMTVSFGDMGSFDIVAKREKS
jgi:hypothetical protein